MSTLPPNTIYHPTVHKLAHSSMDSVSIVPKVKNIDGSLTQVPIERVDTIALLCFFTEQADIHSESLELSPLSLVRTLDAVALGNMIDGFRLVSLNINPNTLHASSVSISTNLIAAGSFKQSVTLRDLDNSSLSPVLLKNVDGEKISVINLDDESYFTFANICLDMHASAKKAKNALMESEVLASDRVKPTASAAALAPTPYTPKGAKAARTTTYVAPVAKTSPAAAPKSPSAPAVKSPAAPAAAATNNASKGILSRFWK